MGFTLIRDAAQEIFCGTHNHKHLHNSRSPPRKLKAGAPVYDEDMIISQPGLSVTYLLTYSTEQSPS
jgi:hypothetical protein